MAESGAETASAANDEGEVLLQWTLAMSSGNAAWVGIERTTLDPGAVWALSENGRFGEGPWLYLVEAGALDVTADGSLSVTRQGSDTPDLPTLGTRVTMHAGDRGVAPRGTAVRWRNAGRERVSVLDTWTSAVGAKTVPGVEHTALIDLWPIKSPMGPLLVTVGRLTLHASDRLAPAAIPGLQGFRVLSGSLLVMSAGNAFSRPSTFPLAAGSGVIDRIGHAGIPPSWTVTSADADPVSLLVLTITSANPLQTAVPWRGALSPPAK
jgi:hypothetical protein